MRPKACASETILLTAQDVEGTHEVSVLGQHHRRDPVGSRLHGDLPLAMVLKCVCDSSLRGRGEALGARWIRQAKREAIRLLLNKAPDPKIPSKKAAMERVEAVIVVGTDHVGLARIRQGEGRIFDAVCVSPDNGADLCARS